VQYTEATDNTSKTKKKMKSMLSAWLYPWQSRSWKVWWQILY